MDGKLRFGIILSFWLDNYTPFRRQHPTGELIFHVMASLAQFERSLISQRVKAGMARAKAQGKRISRPPLAIHKQLEIFELQRQRLSMNKISKQLGIPYGTVYNYVSKLKT